MIPIPQEVSTKYYCNGGLTIETRAVKDRQKLEPARRNIDTRFQEPIFKTEYPVPGTDSRTRVPGSWR